MTNKNARTSCITPQWLMMLPDRARLLDNHPIKYLNSIYENFKSSRMQRPRV